MDTLQLIAGVIAVIAAIVSIIYFTTAYQSFRPFEASSRRANAIIQSGAGSSSSLEQYRKVSGGGDFVEHGIVQGLARGGNLTAPALASALAPFEASYR